MIKKMVTTAMLIALGVVLPMAFHATPNAGGIFLPMHIPILLCGMVCGLPYGLACGVLTPLLSSFLTGMPPAAMLPSMLCELAVYGAFSALLARFVRTKYTYANMYAALIGAMLCGRMVYGILNALIFKAGSYSMQAWLTAAFIQAWPGIVIQIAVIPALVFALQKANVMEPKGHSAA